MTLSFPGRAALSLAIGLTAPILSSACAHDLPQGDPSQSSSRTTRARQSNAGQPNAGQPYATPYQPPPSQIAPEAGTQRLPRSAPSRGPTRGPTYVEAVFESRKSGVGPPFRERFHGFATVGPDGRAVIEIANVGRTVRCSGRSRVTAPPSGPGAMGLRGEAFISCSDGRYAIADYRYVTGTRGEGVGRDYLGNRFTVRFMVVP